MSTVHEVLLRSVNLKDVLQQKSIVVVLDQDLYAKATEIVWKYPDLFKAIVLRMGSYSEFILLYDKYLDYLRNSNGKLSSFWMSYLDIVEILLN